MPYPRLLLTDVAFELRNLWRECIVAYVVSPSISAIVGFSKPSESLLTEVATMVVGNN